MANRGIEEIFDYCFTTIGTIYGIKYAFVIQYMVYAKMRFILFVCAGRSFRG